jgi:hypothetical protein
VKPIDLRISSISGGAIQEMIDMELQKVFENIHDPNTKATDKRSVTIKLEFAPDDKREIINLNSKVSSTLAAIRDVSATVLTGKDLSSGKVVARELKSNMPGQTFLDNDGEVMTDVGDPVDVIEREQAHRNVINLQAGRGN